MVHAEPEIIHYCEFRGTCMCEKRIQSEFTSFIVCNDLEHLIQVLVACGKADSGAEGMRLFARSGTSFSLGTRDMPQSI